MSNPQLIDVKFKITNLNLRSEVHGQERVTAVDIALSWTSTNKMMDDFEPGLMKALYKRANGQAPNPELEGVEPVSEFPQLRFPGLGPIVLSHEWIGYALDIPGGVTNISVTELTLNKVSMTPKEGGSCDFKARLQRSDIDDEDVAHLLPFLMVDVTGSVKISDTMQETMDATPKDKVVSIVPKKEPDATEIFSSSGEPPQAA